MKCFLDKIADDISRGDACYLGPESPDTLILLAHGAGADSFHPFMEAMAQGLAAQGFGVFRFDFPYMRLRRQLGSRRPPDRAPKLLECFSHYVDIAKQSSATKVVLMGKSMGGRMAATLANEVNVDGVICLGYPFVALKGKEPRLAPLQAPLCPVLVLQGERDKFGGVSEVAQWPLAPNVQVQWITDGDHSFVPRKLSGTTTDANLQAAIVASSEFIGRLA
nr:alpha/beta fold hydrolase [Shewanella sp. SNU WT4]